MYIYSLPTNLFDYFLFKSIFCKSFFCFVFLFSAFFLKKKELTALKEGKKNKENCPVVSLLLEGDQDTSASLALNWIIDRHGFF